MAEHLLGIRWDYTRYGSLTQLEAHEEPLTMIYGRPEFVADALNERALSAGFNELAVIPFSLESPTTTVEPQSTAASFLSGLRLFADEVSPRLG